MRNVMFFLQRTRIPFVFVNTCLHDMLTRSRRSTTRENKETTFGVHILGCEPVERCCIPLLFQYLESELLKNANMKALQ